METGNSAAGNSGKQDREQQLYAVSVVNCKTGNSREQLRINIRMSAYDTHDSNDQHSIQQERA